MPRAAPQYCEHAGCKRLVYRRRRKCSLHLKGRPKASASARGYDREYQRNRAYVLLAARGRCHYVIPGVCTGRATETDHVVPLSEGGSSAVSNLRATCHACNMFKMRERRRQRRNTSQHDAT